MEKLFKKYGILLLIIFSTININIFMPLSDNNYLKIALIEILFPILIVIFLKNLINKKIILSNRNRKLLFLITIFLLYYVFLSIIRSFMGYEVKQSLLAIKVTIFPIIILYFMETQKFSRDTIIKNLVLFEFIINCIQLTNYYNFRMSNFLGNIMVYLSIICFIFPFNVYIINNRKFSKSLNVISIFNIFLTAFLPLISGARSSFMVSMFLFFIFFVYSVINKNKKIIISFLVILFSSSTLNAYYWYCQSTVATYANRVLPMFFTQKILDVDSDNVAIHSSDSFLLFINKKSVSRFLSNNNLLLDNMDFSGMVDDEKNKSDALRSILFKKSLESIKKSPLIGTGNIYFDIDTEYGVSQQSAHNFVLEYINAYGIIGFIIYLLIHIHLIKCILKKDKDLLVFFFSSVGSILIQSLVEPTMLIVPVVTIYYIVYSLFLNWGDSNV